VKTLNGFSDNLHCVRTALYHKRTNIWLTVHCLLLANCMEVTLVELRCASTYSSFCSRLKLIMILLGPWIPVFRWDIRKMYIT